MSVYDLVFDLNYQIYVYLKIFTPHTQITGARGITLQKGWKEVQMGHHLPIYLVLFSAKNQLSLYFASLSVCLYPKIVKRV